MITDEQLKAWRAVADKATPGPWRQGDTVPGGIWTADNPKHLLAIGPWNHADVAFIAVARTAVPELIAEIERLRDENCDSPWRAGEQRALESMRQLRDEALKQLTASSAEVERLRAALDVAVVALATIESPLSIGGGYCVYCHARPTLEELHTDNCKWWRQTIALTKARAALGEVKR